MLISNLFRILSVPLNASNLPILDTGKVHSKYEFNFMGFMFLFCVYQFLISNSADSVGHC